MKLFITALFFTLYLGSLLCETAALFDSTCSISLEYETEKEKDLKESKEAKEKIVARNGNGLHETNGINSLLKNRFVTSSCFLSADYSLAVFMPPEAA